MMERRRDSRKRVQPTETQKLAQFRRKTIYGLHRQLVAGKIGIGEIKHILSGKGFSPAEIRRMVKVLADKLMKSTNEGVEAGGRVALRSILSRAGKSDYVQKRIDKFILGQRKKPFKPSRGLIAFAKEHKIAVHQADMAGRYLLRAQTELYANEKARDNFRKAANNPVLFEFILKEVVSPTGIKYIYHFMP